MYKVDYEKTREMLSEALKKGGTRNILATFDGVVCRVGRYDTSDENSEPFVLAKGRQRFGNCLSDFLYRHETQAVSLVERKEQPQADKWRKSWEKVSQRLDNSGLWVDLNAEIKTALAVGFDKLQEAYKQYWATNEGQRLEASKKTNTEKIKAIDARLIGNDKGREFANTSIIWYMSKTAKVKKMNFGKYTTAEYNAQIADAIRAKKDYRIGRIRTSYDISLEYKAEQGKAWYSEEFKDCGNGHYYLALDSTHALFYEND